MERQANQMVWCVSIHLDKDSERQERVEEESKRNCSHLRLTQYLGILTLIRVDFLGVCFEVKLLLSLSKTCYNCAINLKFGT